MESQTFVFMKVDFTLPAPPLKEQNFLTTPEMASVRSISLIAIDRLRISEPEQFFDHSIASRKLLLPVSSNLHSIFQILQVFFKSLSQPVCLVAHNGDNLDFAILKLEFERILNECDDVAGTFDGVHCVDSAKAIAALLCPRNKPTPAEVEKASRNLYKENFEPDQPQSASEPVKSEWKVRSWDGELTLLTTIASDLYDEEHFKRKALEIEVNELYLLSKFGDEKRPGNWKRNVKERKNVNESAPLRGDDSAIEDGVNRVSDLSLTQVYFHIFGEFVLTCSGEGETEALSEIAARLGIPILEVFDRRKELFCAKVFQ